MTKQILVLGASGRIAQLAIQFMLQDPDNQLTLFSRHPLHYQEPQVQVMSGDTLKVADLQKAMKDIDLVYANLSNPKIEEQAKNIVQVMDQYQVKPLIWISSIGIYDEVPGKFGQWNNQMLRGGGDNSYLSTYRRAADIIENSDLDYTIIRPAWLTNKDEVDFETTEKGEAFKGTEVSRKSIGNLVARIAQNPQKFAHRSLGVDKPGSDGDKPSWY